MPFLISSWLSIVFSCFVLFYPSVCLDGFSFLCGFTYFFLVRFRLKSCGDALLLQAMGRLGVCAPLVYTTDEYDARVEFYSFS